jgi:U6 snRNA-associated Sm-like protein LSm8
MCQPVRMVTTIVFFVCMAMTTLISDMIEQQVSIITADGRNLVGKLMGADQLINVVLENCHERLFTEDGVEQIPLGLFIIRGDNVALIGLVDTEQDAKVDFSLIRGVKTIGPIVH